MRKPSIGEYNLGAVGGAVVGSIGGLFAVGLPPAILARRLTLLFETPILGLLCWIVSGLAGWFLGGQIGHRLGEMYRSQPVEVLGGALAGQMPVAGILWWSWHMTTR